MYLGKIYIKNFRGIKVLLAEFDKKLKIEGDSDLPVPLIYK